MQDPLSQRTCNRLLVDALMREEVLVLGRENRVDEERRDLGWVVDEDAMFGRGNARDRLLILGNNHRLLGEVGRVMQSRDCILVDAQAGVDFLGIPRIDCLDQGFQANIAHDAQCHEHAQDKEEMADDPAHKARERPRQRQEDEAEFAAIDLFHQPPFRAGDGTETQLD